MQALFKTHRRWALRLFLVALTVAMGAGIHLASMVSWLPRIKAACVAVTLSGTIASRGVEAAVRQYHRLKVAETAPHDFDERVPDTLGYQPARWSVYD